jgi:hypothetical protein
LGVNFSVYSCDIYGNVVNTTTDLVRMTNSDRFAPNLPSANINMGGGYASFNGFWFHTQGTTTITTNDLTNPAIVSGTTPAVTVNPGPFFGLQILAPGLTYVEGSGNTNVTGVSPVPDGQWYSGVTVTDSSMILPYQASAQLAGIFFSVTVQAADKYGNFVGSCAQDRIRLTSNGVGPSSKPQGSTTPLYGYLNVTSAGKAFFDCMFDSTDANGGIKELRPEDMTNGGPTGIQGYLFSYSAVLMQIAQQSQTGFKVWVNGVKQEDNVPVYIDALPNTFEVRVEVIYTLTGQRVSTNQPFLLEPTLDRLVPPTMAPGSLGPTGSIAGSTFQGAGVISDATYNLAGTIFIRARDSGGTIYPAPAFSPQLIIRASAPKNIRMWASTTSYSQAGVTYYQIQANRSTSVYARITDANNNPVNGSAVSMIIASPVATASNLGAPEQVTTDSDGTMYRTFNAGAQNLLHILQASVGAATPGTLNMYVTVTSAGGVYPNPFNPLQGQSAHIDYPLDNDTNVKVFIYTLLGDLVWHKDYPAGNPEGGHVGVNSISWNGKNDVGVTIGNGGYIVQIKANDQEKYRFKLGVYKEK